MANVKSRIFLGIETSCDDTAVALVDASSRTVLRQCIHQQMEHQAFGGVVPDLASRGHAKHLPKLLNTLLRETGVAKEDIEGIGVTAGPGLAGGLLVGVMFAKGVSISLQKPLWAVNHLQAHSLVPRLCFSQLEFPYLALLFSGGHCEFVIVHSPIEFYLLGYGLDDAAGECLDKIGRRLGFSFPAGAAIEAAAKMGDASAVPLPIPMRDRSLNFSFSGLKSAALRWINESEKVLSFEKKANLCASLQYAIGQSIVKKIDNFFDTLPEHVKLKQAVFCGGVASNQYLRDVLKTCFDRYEVEFLTPPPKYCTDNGAMIAWNASEKCDVGVPPSMNFSIKARWPISV